MPVIIGLTGKRTVGKSTIADHLIENHGFLSVHPFNGGKAMVRGYLQHIGIDAESAWRMTNGDLKDIPCPDLPGGETPRHLMEELGSFMPDKLGPEWTIGKELELAARDNPEGRFIVESIVYEEEVLRQHNATILRVVRDSATTLGRKSDAAVAGIREDGVIDNNGPLSGLEHQIEAALRELDIDLHDETPAPV